MSAAHRVRIGVVGCGAVAQVQHLPNLAFLREEFEIAGLCDLSETRWPAPPPRSTTSPPGSRICGTC